MTRSCIIQSAKSLLTRPVESDNGRDHYCNLLLLHRSGLEHRKPFKSVVVVVVFY